MALPRWKNYLENEDWMRRSRKLKLLTVIISTFAFCVTNYIGLRFLRKGKIGSYRDELNEDQIRKLDEFTEKMLKNSDFKFQE